MSIIKILLLIIVITGFIIFSTALKSKLILRLTFILFIFISVIFILFPNITTTIAHFFGVGRGVDFIIYINLGTVYIVLIILYKKIRVLNSIITKIIRNNAIQNVKKPE
jgi:small membrane protein